MNKIILLLISMIFGLNSQAQDWCAWNFQYDFKIESNNRGEYDFDSLEVNINEEFSSTSLQKSALEYNDSTEVYSINLNYGCVSCGYKDAKHPPTIYLRLYLTDKYRKQNISIVIPVIVEEIDDIGKLKKMEPGENPPFPVYLDLGTIFYENFIFFNATFEKFEGIRVGANGKAHKYKEGEHLFPPTKKLIEVQLTKPKRH